MNNLSRSSQVQAAKQRLASRQGNPGYVRQPNPAEYQQYQQQPQPMVPMGAEQANVAGCGPGACCPPAGVPTLGSVPGLSPLSGAVPAGLFQQNFTPVSIPCTPVGPDGVTAEISCGGRVYFPCGVRSHQESCQVLWTSAVGGSIGIEYLPCGSVDLSAFQTDECFCCFELPCVSPFQPLTLQFAAVGTPSPAPLLSFTLWGTSQGTIGGCYGPAFPFVPPGYGGNGYGGYGGGGGNGSGFGGAAQGGLVWGGMPGTGAAG